jgi:hypothetical protein
VQAPSSGGGGEADAADAVPHALVSVARILGGGGGGGGGSGGGSGEAPAAAAVPMPPPPPQPQPLRAVILDAGLVTDIDATACRELQAALESFAHSQLSPRPRLLLAALRAPARATLEHFGIAGDPALLRLASVEAALAELGKAGA